MLSNMKQKPRKSVNTPSRASSSAPPAGKTGGAAAATTHAGPVVEESKDDSKSVKLTATQKSKATAAAVATAESGTVTHTRGAAPPAMSPSTTATAGARREKPLEGRKKSTTDSKAATRLGTQLHATAHRNAQNSCRSPSITGAVAAAAAVDERAERCGTTRDVAASAANGAASNTVSPPVSRSGKRGEPRGGGGSAGAGAMRRLSQHRSRHAAAGSAGRDGSARSSTQDTAADATVWSGRGSAIGYKADNGSSSFSAVHGDGAGAGTDSVAAEDAFLLVEDLDVCEGSPTSTRPTLSGSPSGTGHGAIGSPSTLWSPRAKDAPAGSSLLPARADDRGHGSVDAPLSAAAQKSPPAFLTIISDGPNNDEAAEECEADSPVVETKAGQTAEMEDDDHDAVVGFSQREAVSSSAKMLRSGSNVERYAHDASAPNDLPCPSARRRSGTKARDRNGKRRLSATSDPSTVDEEDDAAEEEEVASDDDAENETESSEGDDTSPSSSSTSSNSDDDSESDESEESESSDTDEDEVQTFQGSFSKHKKGQEGSSSSRQQELSVKISREGDLNVKMLSITRKTTFKRFLKEVMLRFGFEKATDFDMYCVDPCGDRVDIDLEKDFQRLTATFWAMQDAAVDPPHPRPHPHQPREGSVGRGFPTPAPPPPAAIAMDGRSRGPQHPLVEWDYPQKAASSSATSREGYASSTTAAAAASHAAADKSSSRVVRLYVRDSHRGKLRLQERLSAAPALAWSPSPPSAVALSLGNGAARPLSRDSVGGSRELTQRKFLAALPFGTSSPVGLAEDDLNSEDFAGTAGRARLGAMQASSAASIPDADTPATLSQHFAESQRSLFLRTFHFNEEKEVIWTSMSILGKGSFGTVYEGITSDGKRMAVKVQELPIDEDAAETQSLMREINLMRSLRHKNIVTYYGCQTKTDEAHGGAKRMEIFMELCYGGPLSHMRKRFEAAKKPLGMSIIRSYISQVLEGLAYLHDRNVLHRDLKSDNVLISPLGEAKLSDFGCSKHISGTHTMGVGGGDGGGALNSSASGRNGGGGGKAGHQTLVGSPVFIAPEVLLQEEDNASSDAYSKAADVWSVGCILLELLDREPWTFKNCSNVFQLMFHISRAKGMPTGVPEKATCPPLLYSFFERCFERDPRKRATAAELLTHDWITCPDSQLEPPPPPSSV